MKIYLGGDHAGFELKTSLLKHLNTKVDHQIEDLGTNSQASVDYPDFADKVATRLLTDEASAKGILFCGSGQGMAIRANRYNGIRAALCWNKEIAKLSREHNDANVLCLPSRFVTLQQAIEIIDIFLATAFANGRHSPRVAALDKSLK